MSRASRFVNELADGDEKFAFTHAALDKYFKGLGFSRFYADPTQFKSSSNSSVENLFDGCVYVRLYKNTAGKVVSVCDCSDSLNGPDRHSLDKFSKIVWFFDGNKVAWNARDTGGVINRMNNFLNP